MKLCLCATLCVADYCVGLSNQHYCDEYGVNSVTGAVFSDDDRHIIEPQLQLRNRTMVHGQYTVYLPQRLPFIFGISQSKNLNGFR